MLLMAPTSCSFWLFPAPLKECLSSVNLPASRFLYPVSCNLGLLLLGCTEQVFTYFVTQPSANFQHMKILLATVNTIT